MYIINCIDKNIVNSTVLKNLHDSSKNSTIYYSKRSPEYENIGMGKFPWLIDECLDILIANENKLFLKENVFSLTDIISEQESQTISIKKEYKFDFYEANYNNLISQLFIIFEENGIRVHTKLYKKKFCFYEKQGNLYDKDGVEFVFYR